MRPAEAAPGFRSWVCRYARARTRAPAMLAALNLRWCHSGPPFLASERYQEWLHKKLTCIKLASKNIDRKSRRRRLPSAGAMRRCAILSTRRRQRCQWIVTSPSCR